MGGFGANRWNINYISFFYLYPFFKQRTYRSDAHHICTLNGSNDADSRKVVPFLAFVDTVAHLGDQIAQKRKYWGVNRDFPAKRAKYWNVHIIKTTASIITKF